MHTNHPSLPQSVTACAGIVGMSITALLLSTGQALAQTALCSFLSGYVLDGDIVKGVSTLGVISVAVGATFGRVSWSAAVLVAVGVAGLFGASSIAAALGGGC